MVMFYVFEVAGVSWVSYISFIKCFLCAAHRAHTVFHVCVCAVLPSAAERRRHNAFLVRSLLICNLNLLVPKES